MNVTLVVAGTLLGALFLLSVAALKAWRSWLELRRYEIDIRHSLSERNELGPGARIELADVRERLRRLEAIARGVDL